MPSSTTRRVYVVSAGLLIIASSAAAQDGRVLTEPKIPPACTTLTATLSPVADSTLAEADERKADTKRIQRAIDGCSRGHAVELKASGANTAFLTGPLQLRAGVTLVVDTSAVLFGSRNPRDYDVSPGTCGVVSKDSHGCKPLISARNVAGAGVMGSGTIDGRGWATLIGQRQSWWDLAEDARTAKAEQNCPHLMQLVRADDFTLYRITLKNSGKFHVSYSSGNGFTAWGVIINTPKTARNTDGIDPANSTNVTITHSYIRTGDDNVAIKAGSAGSSSHMTIAHNHFYYGHGMSIGSETNGGANAIRVTDLSIDGADNGIRIKSNASRGGLVHDIVYSDVCMRDVKNPVFMDTHYSFYNTRSDLIPTFQNIVLRDVRVLSGRKITLDGYDATHRLGIAFDNVSLDSTSVSHIHAAHAHITLGPGPVNFRPSGEDVTLTYIKGDAKQDARDTCEDKFVPFPADR